MRAFALFVVVCVYTLGGAMSRVPADRTAVGYRNARHVVIAVGMWEHAADEVNIAGVREVADGLRPFASAGFYPNYEEAAGAIVWLPSSARTSTAVWLP